MKAGKNLLFLFKGEPASIVVTCCWWWWCYLNFRRMDTVCGDDLLICFIENFCIRRPWKWQKKVGSSTRSLVRPFKVQTSDGKARKLSQLVLTTVQTDEKHSKFTRRLAFFRSSSASVFIAFGFVRWNSEMIVSFTVENINKFWGNLCEMGNVFTASTAFQIIFNHNNHQRESWISIGDQRFIWMRNCFALTFAVCCQYLRFRSVELADGY